MQEEQKISAKHKTIEGKAVQVLLVASEEPKDVRSTGTRPKVKSVITLPEHVPSKEEIVHQRHTVKMIPSTPTTITKTMSN